MGEGIKPFFSSFNAIKVFFSYFIVDMWIQLFEYQSKKNYFCSPSESQLGSSFDGASQSEAVPVILLAVGGTRA